jgi:hypothetical protein
MMKRYLVLLIIGLLLLGGCGRQVVEPPPDVEPLVPDKVVERVPQILDADVPERDPFSAGTREGREAESGDVAREGRDPFAVVPNVLIEPEPVVPGPVDPVDPTPPVTGELVVELRTVDRCWLDVFVDGERVLRTNVPSGRTLAWGAERDVVLEQVGRDFGVQLIVNGKEYGLLSSFARQIGRDEYIDRETGVAISIRQVYSGGVLVGVRIRAIERQ